MSRYRWILVAGIPIAVLLLGASPAVPEPDEDAAVRAVIERYLSSVSHPDAPKLDPECFSPDTVGLWSDGRVLKGRKAVLEAHEEAVEEVQALFESFGAEPDFGTVRREGNVAWLHCETVLEGVVKGEEQPFRRTVRSTYVLTKQNGRWQIVHEHSSRRPR